MKRLNKIVERSYFKDASAGKYCLPKDFSRGIWPKKTIVFDADGLPYRGYYYNSRRRKVGVIHPRPEYPGWQFVAETEQKNEGGQTVYYKKEYQDTRSGRMSEEYLYEYQSGIKVHECRITRFEEIVGLTIFQDELFLDVHGLVVHRKSYLNNPDKDEQELVEEVRYAHTYDETGNAIRTDYFKNGTHLLRVCRKYYYDRI